MKGVYVLLMKLERSRRIRIGRLGNVDFKKGFYAYVGSGMNSLGKRIGRHFSKEKKRFWHIDSFLEKCEIYGIVFSESKERRECEVAGKLAERFESVRNFGSSDCKCRSHLFFSGKNFERDVFDVFRESGLKPVVWNQNSSSNSPDSASSPPMPFL
jgi:Uri superfamily endonuclease